jgi:signal peptidase I
MTIRRELQKIKPFLVKMILVGAGVQLVNSNFVTVSQVEGASMQPTLNSKSNGKDYVLVNKFCAHTLDLAPNDVVTFR